jgi:hypothetical protein
MLSIFHRSSIHNVSDERNEVIKILNNVYLTIFKPTVCSEIYASKEGIWPKLNFETKVSNQQTQMVLIKGKLGQFKAIWPCGGGPGF